MTARITALLLALALTAASCGGNGGSSSPTEASAPNHVTSTEPGGGGAESTAPRRDTSVTLGDAVEDDTIASTITSTVEPLAQLRILHPENLAFAAPFTMLDQAGPLSDVADEISLETWTTPDVLRAALVNGNSDVTAVPSYVGANLYNRGVDVRMAAVVVWGLVWVLGPDGTPAEWESLRGQTVMVPFPNDMPDLVFRYLAESNGLIPGEDFTIEYYAQPPEVVGRLVSGQGSFAVLPEHVATLAVAQAGQNGQPIGRVLDLQAEWADATGSSPRIPQAGIVVSNEIADNPTALAAVLDALEVSVDLVNASAPDTVATLTAASGVPGPIITDVIPRLNLDVVAAADVRQELEAFFTELASLSPDIIGGRLPSSDFYLADPR